jgi:hypothetical protein
VTDFNVVDAASVIAAAMGAGWHATPGHYSVAQDAFLCGPDGSAIHAEAVAIHIEAVTWTGSPRLVLSGHFDNRVHEQAPNAREHKITVSSKRTPDQIAADVRRRLLPDYQLALTDAVERKLRTDKERAARDQLAADLAAALGTTVDERRVQPNDNLREVRIGRFGHGLNGGARVTGSNDDVKLSLNVPAAVAVRLATCIAEIRAELGDGHA